MAEIKEREARQASGEGGFANAMALAAKRMQYHLAEGLHDRPGLGTAVGMGMGGLLGATGGPMLAAEAQKLPEHYRNIKELISKKR
jgi:hypothetical protein